MRNLVFVMILLGGSVLPAVAQKTLEGVIRDGKGQPVEGASILLTGTKSFAVASSSGKFKLQLNSAPSFTLQISSVDYSSADVVLQSLPDSLLSIVLIENNQMADLVITSRRRIETVQQMPIAISVVGGKQVEDAGAFNVNRLKELVPTLQLYSSNPRNTTLNIRGTGSTFGLTNDGIDPGVGFYVDGVYYARPAATTFPNSLTQFANREFAVITAALRPCDLRTKS
jgi:iron complex outermembrane receptor protein